jgi:outer membrane protein OmpA-like peptidoglycan-associated protein
MLKRIISAVGAFALVSFAQVPNPTQSPSGVSTNQVVVSDHQPLFRVTVVSRTTKAINYRHRSGSTRVDFHGTALMPQANGEAKVESRQGDIRISVEAEKLMPASTFGGEYLTYVLWAVSPEGRPENLGEILLNGGGKTKIEATTQLQAFGLIITAEPYFDVPQPSDVVVMENIIRTDTLGKIEEIDAKYELIQRGQYVYNIDRSQVTPIRLDPKTPLEVFEARNAVRIARWSKADKYADDTFRKSETLLQQSEDYLIRKQTKPSQMIAREAVQTAENARIISLKRQQEENLANEREAAAARIAKSKADADEAGRQQALAQQQAQLEAQRRAQADSERAAADQARLQAQNERMAADRAKAEAEAASAAALAQQQLAQQEAERARLATSQAQSAAAKAEADKEALRQQLLQQFNLILETRDTARGLVVNMSDVLFDTAKYDLRPGAREKLARLSGIVLSHPGLRLEVEGHTDSVGSEDYNQTLSEHRADSVRTYLTTQGIPSDSVTSKGFGKTMPVATNDTSAGRQQNRRVEIVVSGEVIGTKLSDIRTGTGANR